MIVTMTTDMADKIKRPLSRTFRQVGLASLFMLPLLVLVTGCLNFENPPPVFQGAATIKYATYETTSLGPYPIHQAGDQEKFVVLDMMITNNSLLENLLVHRLYFFLVTANQRFTAASNASSMPDLRYPINNNSEILPGGSVRQMTFFRVPENLTDYSFEYDNDWPGHFDNDTLLWERVEAF